jgi:hypothetical protein
MMMTAMAIETHPPEIDPNAAQVSLSPLGPGLGLIVRAMDGSPADMRDDQSKTGYGYATMADPGHEAATWWPGAQGTSVRQATPIYALGNALGDSLAQANTPIGRPVNSMDMVQPGSIDSCNGLTPQQALDSVPGDRSADENPLPNPAYTRAEVGNSNAYAEMLTNVTSTDSEYDFVSRDQLKYLARKADENGGILPKGILESDESYRAPTYLDQAEVDRETQLLADKPPIAVDPLNPNSAFDIPFVVVSGHRMSPQERDSYDNEQMWNSMRLKTWNTISDKRIQSAADRLKVPEAAIRTVAEVETKGGGFIAPGKPSILFERHKFSLLTSNKFDDQYPDISDPTAGGYGKGGNHQYDRLAIAMTLNSSAALSSTSWGQFQILDMNYQQAGFNSVEDFVKANQEGSDRQLDTFVTFIQNDSKLLQALRDQDWSTFARRYNGPNYKINDYDTKLRNAYEKFNH